MKLGFVSAILPDLSLEQVAEFAQRAGYSCVEVMCWPVGAADRRYAGVTHLDVAKFDAKQAAQVEDLFARHGLELSGLGYYPNPLMPDATEAKRTIDHLERVIRAASLLKCRRINT